SALLVSQGDGPDAVRTAGPLAVLALVHRLPPNIWADAHFRDARHAAANLLLSTRARLGDLEPAEHNWGHNPGAQLPDLRLELALFAQARPPGGKRPLGRLDTGGGDALAAPAVQL